MIEALIAAGSAIVVGVLSLVGVIYSNNRSRDKMQTQIQSDIKVAMAVMDERIDELTREVRTHNGFATRVPVLEQQQKANDRRLKNLEEYHKGH